MKKLLHPILWIIAGAVLFWSLIYIGLSLNLFSWNPTLDWKTSLAIAMVIFGEIFIFWLTRKLKNTIAIITALLVCLVLTVYGTALCIALQNETIFHEATGLAAILTSRSTLSPMWYRITLSTLYYIPLILWVSQMYNIKKANQHMDFTVKTPVD